MRLTLSLLVATAFHGAAFGVAAVVWGGPARAPVAPASVEVEIVAARPDPMALSAAPAAEVAAGPPSPLAAGRHDPRPRALARASDARTAVSTKPASAAPELAPPSALAPSPVTAVDLAPAAPARAPSAFVRGADGAPGVLSTQPRYRSNPLPEYPLASRRRHEEGVVRLDVVLDPSGRPAKVALNRSSGHRLLDQAALGAVRHWTFEPARAGGVPVSSVVTVSLRFSPAQ